MQGRLTAPQKSLMDVTEPLWCERTQDMSGYVMMDIISPPLDEQFDFNISTAQHENDSYVQNLENPPTEEFLFNDQPESVLGEDSNMFDNSSNYSELHSKMKEWLPKISTVDIDEFAQTTMIEKHGSFTPRIDSENSFISETPKEYKTPSASVVKNKKPGYFAVFDNEEPHIKEDLDTLSCCTEYKSNYELKDEMEVAEEVVVTTEEHQEPRSNCSDQFFYDPYSLGFPVETKEEVVVTSDPVEYPTSPLRRASPMESSYDYILGFPGEDDFLLDLNSPSPVVPGPKAAPQLHLDIEAAMVFSNQLLSGDLPDTPDVLRPVLNPGADFDIINYLLNNGDSNNNAITPPTPSTKPFVQRLQERRHGKSHLSLSDLKECQKYGRGKPSTKPSEKQEPSPGPSSSSSISHRPERKSATKFKRLIEEGILDATLDSASMSSDDEMLPPRSKRRRTTSSSSNRRRHNSESDHSSVCDNGLKYRERRDRNNLSSKRSRQKRKDQQKLKKEELKELEAENKRLKKIEKELEAVLNRAQAAWKEFLINMKKET